MKRLLCITSAALLMLLCVLPAQAAVNGIFLGSDENGVNILNDTLRPGTEYYFPVLVAVDGAPPTQLTAQDTQRSRLKVRTANGAKAVQEVEVAEKNGLVYIRLVPGGRGTTQLLRGTLRVNYQNGDTGDNLTILPEITAGYAVMGDEKLTTLEPGEFLQPDNAAPIIMPQQWQELSRINDHREVTLTGADWRYSVHVSGLGRRNLLVTHEPVMGLVRELPDQQLHFIGFAGEPDFAIKGKLVLDVSGIAEEYGHDFFLYRYAYGKLYSLKYDYDKDAAEISLRPSQLSTYLITDKRIQLADNEPVPPGSSSTPSANNPETGVAETGWRLVAGLAALVSAAGLGLMTASKRR